MLSVRKPGCSLPFGLRRICSTVSLRFDSQPSPTPPPPLPFVVVGRRRLQSLSVSIAQRTHGLLPSSLTFPFSSPAMTCCQQASFRRRLVVGGSRLLVTRGCLSAPSGGGGSCFLSSGGVFGLGRHHHGRMGRSPPCRYGRWPNEVRIMSMPFCFTCTVYVRRLSFARSHISHLAASANKYASVSYC